MQGYDIIVISLHVLVGLFYRGLELFVRIFGRCLVLWPDEGTNSRNQRRCRGNDIRPRFESLRFRVWRIAVTPAPSEMQNEVLSSYLRHRLFFNLAFLLLAGHV
jgi:hypothetical protein